MNSSLKSGFVWTSLEKVLIQIMQFGLGVLIARYITPEEYGILGVLMVFINISQVFIDSGLGSALIYNNTLDDEDLQTVFSFNLVVSIVLFLIIILIAKPFEIFLNMNDFALYLGVSAIVLIINAFILVPTSILRVKMDFKSIAISNLISTLLSGILGVMFAIYGYGIWALILQLLTKSITQMLILGCTSRWKPKLKFYRHSFITMYKYSLAIFGTSCITKISSEGISFFVAKILTPYNLGIFTRANQFVSAAGTALGSIFGTVLFPAFSSMKNNMVDFYRLYNRMLTIQSLVIIPLFILLAVLSKPIVLLLLTEKWIDVIPILQILAIGRIFSTISYVTEQAIYSIGRSDLEFKQQRDKIIVKLLFVIGGFKFGLLGIAVADALSTILSFWITNHYAKKCLQIKSTEQLRSILPFLLFSILSACPTLYIITFTHSSVQGIFLGTAIFMSLYMMLLYLFKRTLLVKIFEAVKKYIAWS